MLYVSSIRSASCGYLSRKTLQRVTNLKIIWGVAMTGSQPAASTIQLHEGMLVSPEEWPLRSPWFVYFRPAALGRCTLAGECNGGAEARNAILAHEANVHLGFVQRS